MRVLLYLAMIISGFFNIVTAAGLLFRGLFEGFAWTILISLAVGYGLVLWMSLTRRFVLAGFAGLACSAGILIGYLIFIGELTVNLYTGHLHILFVPLFAFLCALFFNKAYRSKKRIESERPLRSDESIIGR